MEHGVRPAWGSPSLPGMFSDLPVAPPSWGSCPAAVSPLRPLLASCTAPVPSQFSFRAPLPMGAGSQKRQEGPS